MDDAGKPVTDEKGRMLTADMVSEVVYYTPVWADLYGTGQPVRCTVAMHRSTHHPTGKKRYTVRRQELFSYWKVEPKSGKWVKTELKKPVPTEDPGELDLDKLKGLLGPPGTGG